MAFSQVCCLWPVPRCVVCGLFLGVLSVACSQVCCLWPFPRCVVCDLLCMATNSNKVWILAVFIEILSEGLSNSSLLRQ